MNLPEFDRSLQRCATSSLKRMHGYGSAAAMVIATPVK
jgi:hypothetical protein